jgi:nitrite reductase/ring-hydroxylating ferredoxin subunit
MRLQMLRALQNSGNPSSLRRELRMSEKNRRDALTGSRSHHAKSPAPSRFKVARVDELKPGESKKFLMPIRGADEECFIINFDGALHAYVNRCRHVPMPMDWVDNQFFAEEGRYLTCQTHNAYYEPGSGECVAGPHSACGKFLYRVPLEIKDDVVYAHPPQEEFADDGI